MDSRELSDKIAALLDEKKASDIVIIDIALRSSFADFFVNATANSLRQLQSLAEEVEDKLAELEIIPKNLEGRNGSEWILLDYGDVVVNIFTAEAREKYHLEKVWGDCEMINYERA
ncbi:MAG: ribosome silencing factor [Firmicutes bacterium]|nr:ribosome silencing factor [Bacillota bacterium]MBR6025650.1 ribosome silencing factor [Bacillota bacterium]